MILTPDEHIEQAELMLREAAQDLAQAHTQDSYRRLEINVQIAAVHALLGGMA